MLTGSEFVKRILNLTDVVRENATIHAVRDGELPPWNLENWQEVSWLAGLNGDIARFDVYVTPDVFGFGPPEDYYRAPIWRATAERIADLLDLGGLPTRRVAEAVWDNARLRLEPITQTPTFATANFAEHNAKIEAAIAKEGMVLPYFVAGQGKDLVWDCDLDPAKVAIYFWKHLDGRIQQPFNKKDHYYGYLDYSHKPRFVHKTMLVNRQPMLYRDALRDPKLCKGLGLDHPMTPQDFKGNGPGLAL